MKGRKQFCTLLLPGLTACLSINAASQSPYWSYEGPAAPEHWGKLSPEFSLCETGKNQSPVNIQGALKTHHQTAELTFSPGKQNITNNGHSVQINVSEGNTLQLDNSTWMLQQFHFHAPAENEIKGKKFPLEVHFVYTNKDNALAVLALMFEKGKVNSHLAQIWQQMPAAVDSTMALSSPLDIRKFLPQQLNYYRFSGSLTTPPCTEGVIWMVLEEPVSVSDEQISQFHSVIHHANNRPVQPLNGRIIIN